MTGNDSGVGEYPDAAATCNPTDDLTRADARVQDNPLVGHSGYAWGTYQDVHPLYRQLGWPALPLAAGTKLPPPSGYTGWDGIDPSFADCQAWCELEYAGTRQLALRMPPTVVGLDTDAYDGKTGARTIAEGERRWGPLPAGPWSSARDDGISGIRFYRVPDGTVLVSNIAFPELRLGHVEVIQRHHRYAVAWPSVHPKTGGAYTWRDTGGPDVPPPVDDLPELPVTWLEWLAGTGQPGEQRVSSTEVTAFLAELPRGAACLDVRTALRDADAALREPIECRHDDTLRSVLRLLRLAERGHPGVAAALGALGEVFIRTVVADGSRTTASAAAEFARMREGERGVGLIRSTPTPPEQRGCRCGREAPPLTRERLAAILRTALNAEGPDRAPLLRWAVGKLRAGVVAGQLDGVYVERVVEQLTATVGGAR